MHGKDERGETVTIVLGKGETPVLGDLLDRWQQSAFGFTLDLKHDAEWHALSRVLGALEPRPVEPFQADYADLLTPARATLVVWWGSVER